MICEKTGAVIFLQPYGCSIRGDAYLVGNHLLLRVNNQSRDEGGPVLHFIVENVCQWFDETYAFGTIISDKFTYLGYDGKTLAELEAMRRDD